MISPKLDISPRDLAFAQAVKLLEQVKLVCGGMEVSYTLKKRPVLKRFLLEYIHDHHTKCFNDLEETIADLNN